jgi:hypothetical protein
MGCNYSNIQFLYIDKNKRQRVVVGGSIFHSGDPTLRSSEGQH